MAHRITTNPKYIRSRTVDDDLADSNLTRKDNVDLACGAYRFSRVWGYYRKHENWHSRPGGPLSYDHYYIKPDKDLDTGIEGEDFFYGEAALVQYAIQQELFGEFGEMGHGIDDGLEQNTKAETLVPEHSSPRGTRTTDCPRNQPVQTVSSTTSNIQQNPRDTVSPSARETGSNECTGIGPRNEPVKTVSSTTSNSTNHIIENGANKKLKRILKNLEMHRSTKGEKVHRRQWPAGHPLKGRHPEDAISLLDSSSDENEKSVDIETVDRGLDNGNDSSSETSESDEKANSDMVKVERTQPLLSTVKRSRGPSSPRTQGKRMYQRLYPTARKVKSGPRGLLFSGEPSKFDNSGRDEQSWVGEIEAMPRSPLPPKSSRHVPNVAKARMKVHSPNQTRTKIRLHPTKRSEVEPSTKSSQDIDITDVVFPSLPDESFHIVISTSGQKTKVWMEQQATKEQRQLIVADITKLPDATSAHLIPAHAILASLETNLKALQHGSSDTTSGNKKSQDVKPDIKDMSLPNNMPGVVDCIRDGQALTVTLTFPCWEMWSVSHVFPMKIISTQELMLELKRENESLKRHNDEVVQENKNLRRENESLKRHNDEVVQENKNLRSLYYQS